MHDPDARVALSGNLAVTPLMSLCSTLESQGKSAQIRLATELGPGTLWFREGTLVDAEFDASEGEAALSRLLTLEEGRFEVVFTSVDRPQVVQSSPGAVVQQRRARSAEWARLLDEGPNLNAVLHVDPEGSEDPGLPPTQRELLGHFDGNRCVIDAIDRVGRDAVETMRDVVALVDRGVLTVGRTYSEIPPSGGFTPDILAGVALRPPALPRFDVTSRIPREEPPEEAAVPTKTGGSRYSSRPGTVEVVNVTRTSSPPPTNSGPSTKRIGSPPAAEEQFERSIPGKKTLSVATPPDVQEAIAAMTQRYPAEPPSPVVAVGVAQHPIEPPSPQTVVGRAQHYPVEPPSPQTVVGRAQNYPVEPSGPQTVVGLAQQYPVEPPSPQTVVGRAAVVGVAPAEPPNPQPVVGVSQQYPAEPLGPEAVPLAPPATAARAGLDEDDELGHAAVPARGATARGSAQQPSTEGVFLGKYEVLCRLGRGGMGTVYLCRVTGAAGFRRLYALKVLRQRMPEGSAAERFFLTEAFAASRLTHPNVVAVIDADIERGQPYLVLEYVEGCNLATLLARSPERRPAALVTTLMLDALNGLAAAHALTDDTGRALGLVHCDLSPENLLVGVDGACRVSDFGVARLGTMDDRFRGGATSRGKAAYVSPELVQGRALDQRSDVFSMGAVLWNALTGRQLFLAPTQEEILQNILAAEIPPPSRVGLKPPPAFDEVCARALARDPNRRFSSAQEMAEAIRRVAVQHDLLAAPSEIADWVRGVFGAELQQRRLASLDASRRAAESDRAPRTLPRAVTIPPPPAADRADHPAPPAAADHAARPEANPGRDPRLPDTERPDAPEPKWKSRVRNGVIIAAVALAFGVIALCVAKPDLMARWFKIETLSELQRTAPQTPSAAPEEPTVELPWEPAPLDSVVAPAPSEASPPGSNTAE